MNQQTLIAVVSIVLAVVVFAAIVVALVRKLRSRHLKEHFGAEYDRTVMQRGDPAKAELELIKREKRVHSFAIRTLTPAGRDRFREEWTLIQSRFVDDPAIAVNEADSLVNRLMTAKGYPMAEFEQRAADISVSYPTVVENYRSRSRSSYCAISLAKPEPKIYARPWCTTTHCSTSCWACPALSPLREMVHTGGLL